VTAGENDDESAAKPVAKKRKAPAKAKKEEPKEELSAEEEKEALSTEDEKPASKKRKVRMTWALSHEEIQADSTRTNSPARSRRSKAIPRVNLPRRLLLE
jgi:hypothetical protein